jgi:hypothetical protein
MSQPQEPDRARRRFLKTLGIAGITTALGPAARSFAQTTPAGPAIYPPGVPPPKGAAPAAGGKEAPSEDAHALAAIIRRRYGKFLNSGQVDSITRDFDGDLQAAKRLHDFKLTNGDEPDVTFHA